MSEILQRKELKNKCSSNVTSSSLQCYENDTPKKIKSES